MPPASVVQLDTQTNRPANVIERRSHDAYTLRRPAGAGIAVDGIAHDVLAQLIDGPAGPLQSGAYELIKQGRSTTLVRTALEIDGKPAAVAYKHIRPTGRLKALLAPFRRQRAWKAWRCGYALLERGIATPRPLAAVIPRAWRIGGDSALAAEWIDGGLNLHYFCLKVQALEAAARYATLKAAVESLAHVLGTMHARRISNRDLKAGNLLIQGDGENAQAYVIDLDGVQFRWWLPWRLRLRNLARLTADLHVHRCITKSVQLRFLKAYLSTSKTALDWKTAWKRIMKLRSRQLHRRAGQ